MQPPLRLAAQLLLAVVAAAMLLTWTEVARDESFVGPTLAEDSSVRGLDVNEGQLVLVVAVITIGLVQAGPRPAWMGAGFTLAVAGRALLNALSDDLIDPGIGLWVASAAALVATMLLVADVFRSIRTDAPRG